jgi:hypothetical protein
MCVIIALRCAGGVAQLKPLVVDASVNELADGYKEFKHGVPLKVDLPSVDLYTRDGRSVFHGTNDVSNARFISSLSSGSPIPTAVITRRPTLEEALQIIPALRPFKSRFLSTGHPTLLAFTYPNWQDAANQNKLLAELETRSHASMQIIEVRLHQ